MKSIIFLLTMFLSTNVFSEILVKDYLKHKNEEQVKSYVMGVGVGYGWSNVKLMIRGEKQLFCLPPNLSLNQQNYLTIIDDALKNSKPKEADDTPIELILINQLIKTFPCK